jgi:hypothetical protein
MFFIRGQYHPPRIEFYFIYARYKMKYRERPSENYSAPLGRES